MPGLLDSCQEFYGTKNLYEALSVPKTANEKELKRAYHKKSLQVHPDRVPEADKKDATLKFQILSKVYVILANAETRGIYDLSGEVDDESDVVQDRDWDNYWRLLFKKITIEDIKNFEKTYKGSDEELEDLKSAYTDYQGDMDKIMEEVLCCAYEDEARFTKILQDLISSGELTAYTKFTKETKKKKESRKKRFEQEAAEAAEMLKEMGGGGDMSQENLEQMIVKRQEERGSKEDEFLEHLATKYAQPKGRKGKADAADKPAAAKRNKKNEAPVNNKPNEVSTRPKRGKKAVAEPVENAEVSVETKPKGRKGKKTEQNSENEENNVETQPTDVDAKKANGVEAKKTKRGKKAESSDEEKAEPKTNSRTKKAASDEPKSKRSRKQKAEEPASKLQEIEEEIENEEDPSEEAAEEPEPKAKEEKPAPKKKETKKKEEKEVKSRTNKKTGGAGEADDENEPVEDKKKAIKNNETTETNSKPTRGKATRGRSAKK